MILEKRPVDFRPIIQVVGCYLHYQSKFLLLQRNSNKTHGGQWGLPAGKIDQGEDKYQAVIRETYEETGINLEPEDLVLNCSLDVRNNGHDLIFHIFEANLDSKPDVKLEKHEHQDFKWVTPDDSMQLDYVHDLDSCNKRVFN